jgi:hypothetical protein
MASSMDRPPDAQAGCTLARCPIEIILRISSFLSTPSLGAFRRTCRLFEKDLFRSFAHEFFTKKQFMLTEESLNALLEISRHSTLSVQLEHLIIGLDRYDPAYRGRLADAQRATAYRIATAKQFNFLATGRAPLVLSEALKNLSRLKTIDIRDFNNAKRLRDGPDAQWTSYGATTARNEMGVRLPMQHYPREDYASTVFAIVLAAIANAGVTPPNLEVLLRSKGWGLHDICFLIPDHLNGSINATLQNLKRLHLDVDLNAGQMPGAGMVGNDVVCKPGYLLRRFLSKTDNITWLRLNFQMSNHSNADAFLQWLGSQPLAADAVTLSSLQRLDLGSVEVSSKTLVRLIAKFGPTLRGLNLWRMSIQDSNGNDDRTNIWQNIFKRLLTATPWLTSILVGDISHAKVGSGLSFGVCFRESAVANAGQIPPIPDRKREFSGSVESMATFLEKMAADTVVLWPDPMPGDTSDDSDGDSADED